MLKITNAVSLILIAISATIVIMSIVEPSLWSTGMRAFHSALNGILVGWSVRGMLK